MQISKREFLRSLGLAGVAGVAGLARADEPVISSGKLPEGSCGDPCNPYFGRNIFPLPRSMEDGESCFMKDGKVYEPAREISVFHQTDVVVVGGGPAGFSAAVAAARAGAKAALVERYGSLGGLFTNGLVLIMLCTSRREDGRWRLVQGGLVTEFADRARALGADVCDYGTKDWDGKRHWQPTVDPEGGKYLMDRMVEEAGVDMFFHCWGVDVIQDGMKTKGIVFDSKQGRQAILAKQVVDCTGDADLLFAAGGDYREITHAIGHVVRLGNIDRVTAKGKPPHAKGPWSFWPTRSNEPGKTMWWGNYGTGPKGSGLSVRDLTAAEIDFRRKWWEQVRVLRKTPGWEQVVLANTCSQIGPRATRLVDTEIVMDRAVLRNWKTPDDAIGWMGDDGVHKAWAVPYRSIVPKKVENMLVAGRCLGAGDTIDTFRLICPCFVTGQAAGVAAALAAKGGVTPRDLDVSRIRAELIRQNAVI